MPWGGISFPVSCPVSRDFPEFFAGNPAPDPPETLSSWDNLAKHKVYLLISSKLHT